MDSNHRSDTQQIYSLLPLATREILQFYGASNRTRTYDLLITNQLLYQLSYTSILIKFIGGNNRDRTCDPLLVRQMLSQLSYAPIGNSLIIKLVEDGGFEPPKRYATDLQSAPFGHSGNPPVLWS